MVKPSRILITGFEPFGDMDVNPTEVLVRELREHLEKRGEWSKEVLDGIETRVLPVTSEASDIVNGLLGTSGDAQYDTVIHLGLHGKIDDFALERVGINIDDYRIPDNREKVRDRPIDENGENALFSTLPVRDIEDALIEQGIPRHVSYSAGTYLCNHLLYTTLNHIATHDLRTQAGFIHLPRFEMMDKMTMMNGLRTMLRMILK